MSLAHLRVESVRESFGANKFNSYLFSGQQSLQHAARSTTPRQGSSAWNAKIKYLFVWGQWEFVPFIWLGVGGRAGRGSKAQLEHFGLPIPGLHFGNFLQIYACLFAVMILARFRAHPFYYIWRNQKSLLLIKTYFTARSFVRPTAIKWKCKCEYKNESEKPKKKKKEVKYRQDKPLWNGPFIRQQLFALWSFLLFSLPFFPLLFSLHKLFVLLINIQLVKLNVLSAQHSSVECRLSYS